MQEHEGRNLEFKREWSDGIKRSLSAFANTDGGTLLIGVNDDGTTAGLDNPDLTIRQLMQAATNAIRPDLSRFIDAHIAQRDGKDVIVVQVHRGSNQPYYLTDKGLRPSGVYVRMGAASMPASEETILDMIRNSSGQSYETTRSLEQDLAFEQTARVFEQSKVAFGTAEQHTLGLLDADGMYTNLAWLLSDQCEASIKLAVFDGEDKTRFLDRKELTGSLLTQFDSAVAFLEQHNALQSDIGADMRRTDQWRYPLLAVREGLVNLIAHRDYGLSGPGLISVFSDRLEITNLGGLPKGLTKSDMMLGVSLQRNPKLAQVMYRLRLVEAYGTGIGKIMDSYASSENHPRFDITSNAFKLTLPRFVAATPIAPSVPKLQDIVLELLQQHDGPLSRSDIQKAIGLPQASAARVLRKLVDQGFARREGNGPSTKYRKA